MSDDFKIWWHNEGSGMPSFKDEETCDHVERVSAIAWSNGAFKAALSLEAENARLKAEVERLKAFSDEAQAHIAKEERKSRERLDMAQQELARLRASSFVTAVPVEHYERVVKAGDAMAMTLQADYNGVPYEPHVIINAIIYWRAAKEGKPSV